MKKLPAHKAIRGKEIRGSHSTLLKDCDYLIRAVAHSIYNYRLATLRKVAP